MKREIRFRGLRTDGKGWVYGMLFHNNKIVTETVSYESPLVEKGSQCYKYDYINIIPESVGQFTGLKDINGKKVYEGDVLSDGEKEPMILPVIYSDEYAMFCVDISYNKDGGAIEEILTCYKGGFTVVGNIHENPDLLNN